MNTIAQIVGVHETTVSRAIANKYIRTPHGVFPFKYFFTPGYKAGSGESVSNKSIKDMISHIIEEENPAKPYQRPRHRQHLNRKEDQDRPPHRGQIPRRARHSTDQLEAKIRIISADKAELGTY